MDETPETDLYMEEIAPLVEQIAAICKENGVCFIANFHLPEGVRYASVGATKDGLIPRDFVTAGKAMGIGE